MRRLLITLFTLILSLGNLIAQTDSRILYLSEGATDGLFASVNPQNGNVQVFDTLSEPSFMGASYNDILIHENRVFVAAGNSNVLVYDVHSMTLVDSITGVVARELAIYNDLLLMTTYDAPYFRAYTLDDLTLASSLDTSKVTDEAENLVVLGDTAFVTVNGLNGFGDNARVGDALVAIDLTVIDTIAVLTVGANPDGLMVSGDNLYVKALVGAFPNAQFELVGVSTDPLSVVSRDTLLDGNFYGPSVSDGALVYYQDTTPALVAWDPMSGITTTQLAGDFYAADYSPAAGAFLLSQGGFGADTSRILVWSPVGIGFGQPDTFIVEAGNGPHNSVRTVRWVNAPAFPPAMVEGTEISPGVYCSDSALTLNFESPAWLTAASTEFMGTPIAHFDVLDLQGLSLTPGVYDFTTTMHYLGMSVETTTTLEVEECLTGRRDVLLAQIDVFPNPASSAFSIHFDAPQRGHCEVYDAMGKRVLAKAIAQQDARLNCSDWAAGVYWLRIQTERGSAVRKLIKQ